MKRILNIGLVLLLAGVFFAGQAMAGEYRVTTESGTRVQEKGTCERVGSIQFARESGTFFQADNVLRIELLGAATVCHTVDALYDYAGLLVASLGTDGIWYDNLTVPRAAITLSGVDTTPANGLDDTLDALAWDYRLKGTLGADLFTITFKNASTATTDVVIVGHDDIPAVAAGPLVDASSPLCVDLSNTNYSASDPALQVISWTFKDTDGNNFTGDSVVATVKPAAHAIALCTKTEGGAVGAVGWATTATVTATVDDKTGILGIPVCPPGQGQTCGITEKAIQEVCVSVTDLQNFFKDTTYSWTIGTSQAGVGINGIKDIMVDVAGVMTSITDVAWAVPGTFGIAERYDANGNKMTAGAGGFTKEQIVATKKLKVNTTYPTFTEGETLYVIIQIAYDSCTVALGDLNMDIAFNLSPCGDSMAVTDYTVATFTECSSGASASYSRIFPYVTDTASGWWSGLALTNPTDTALTVTFRAYEADGDMYTFSESVPAMGQVVMGTDAIVVTADAASTDAAFGDESFWMVGSASADFQGFLLMGTDGGHLQGYLAPKASGTTY